MKRSPGMSSMRFAMLATVAFALALAVPALASAPRAGILDVTKNCDQWQGARR